MNTKNVRRICCCHLLTVQHHQNQSIFILRVHVNWYEEGYYRYMYMDTKNVGRICCCHLLTVHQHQNQSIFILRVQVNWYEEGW